MSDTDCITLTLTAQTGFLGSGTNVVLNNLPLTLVTVVS